MSMRINDFANASPSVLALHNAMQFTQRSIARLSSGARIVDTSDDAAGAAVSAKLKASINRADATAKNLSNAESFLQTQDGALDAIGKGITRMMELKTLSLDPTKSPADLDNYNSEFVQLQQSIKTISQMKFNGIDLFSQTDTDTYLNVTSDENGQQTQSIKQFSISAIIAQVLPTTADTYSYVAGTFTSFDLARADAIAKGGDLATIETLTKWNDIVAAIGPNSSKYLLVGAYQPSGSVEPKGGWVWLTGDPVDWSLGNSVNVDNYGSGQDCLTVILYEGMLLFDDKTAPVIEGYILETSANDLFAISNSTLDASLQSVATCRAANGASSSTLGHAIENIRTKSVNLEAANSKIADVDMAAETQKLNKAQILSQISALAIKQSTSAQKITLQLIDRQQADF